jgi:hypothetical protein
MNLAETGNLAELSDEEFRVKLAQLVAIAQKDRQENALRYYTPVSKTAARVWESDARVLAIGGGNGSGKTEQMLAFAIACATGVFPDSMKHLAAKLFRGPINVRIVCESLTTVLYPDDAAEAAVVEVDRSRPAGRRARPLGLDPALLPEGPEWEKSWSEKLRILTVLCRDPRT